MTPLSTSPRPGLRLAVGLLGIVLVAAPALAEDAPVLTPPQTAALDDASRIQAPPLEDHSTATPTSLEPGWTEPIQLPPDPRFHKGCVYTDLAEGRPAGPLTEREQLKLAMARTAVEAARASGVSIDWSPLLQDEAPPPADLEAMKLQRLRDTVPPELPEDPAAGVADIPARQETGSPGLTPYEIDKLHGLSPDPRRAEDPSVRSERIAEGDGAPAPREEGTSHD